MNLDTSNENVIYRFIVRPKHEDHRSISLIRDAHALGLTNVKHISAYDLYFIKGQLCNTDLSLLSSRLLHDPVTHTITWNKELNDSQLRESMPDGQIIDVTLKSGVTNAVANQILRAAQLLGLQTIQAVSTGLRFVVTGDNLSEPDFHNLAVRLFSNPVIQNYSLGEKVFLFPVFKSGKQNTEVISLRRLSDEELIKLSDDRRASLNLEEMKVIQAYCLQEERDLRDIEFETIAQTWSEHCVHKTFKARIEQDGDGSVLYENLFNETIRAATKKIGAAWVRSAFTDNAGVIDFDDEFELSFKVETHNHPSAIEPFGGANTGVGGVIRDVIGVSAKPIATTDVLCFGPQSMRFQDLPEGVMHPRRIFSGVVSGIEDYGNKIGVPTVSGAIWFDQGFTANPLVFCGCVGMAPKGSHPRNPKPGDQIVVIGGRTGRDGLRGATFSSMTMDAQTGEVSGASVQIGAPIVEKGLIDVVMIARDEGLYHAITDCGAGGLSSAVGEMSSQLGAAVSLERVPLKYAELAPWEIWLSEAQERMVLAVPKENLERLRQICDRYWVEMTDIGSFTDTGRLKVGYHEEIILDLDNQFLHHGLPQRRLLARLPAPSQTSGVAGHASDCTVDCQELLLRLLSHPNIASKEKVIRVYDHEVQGGSVVRPLVGINHDSPSDAVVLKPQSSKGKQAVVISAGINPEYGKYDAYQMALNCIDEAIRNAVAVGANTARIALLDNFCWGDPERMETLGTLVQAVQGCYDGAVYFGTPFISGKDSLNNEYIGADGKRHAIPGTLLISAISVLESWDLTVTSDLKGEGNLIYLVGEMNPVFGGSHFHLVYGSEICGEEYTVPVLSPKTKETYTSLHGAIQENLVLSCHDLSEGGLAVAASEMCFGGMLGMRLQIDDAEPLRTLFGETTGCLLVEVSPEKKQHFEKKMRKASLLQLGVVTETQRLHIENSEEDLIDLDLNTLIRAWKAHLVEETLP